jgi:hypothetical protein
MFTINKRLRPSNCVPLITSFAVLFDTYLIYKNRFIIYTYFDQQYNRYRVRDSKTEEQIKAHFKD